ncbi:DNA metabolism protein [Lithospermum erythrorhizon]|uniref:DNA metabolism protein n=1 Tax=Lithospermum erythrorhizon TaxID=34254 RepID=A0AAV3QWG3_LITER
MAPKPPSSSLPHPKTTTSIDNSLKRPPLKPYNLNTITTTPLSKKPKNYPISNQGKENDIYVSQELETGSVLSLDSIPSSIDFTQHVVCNKENNFRDVRSNKFYSNSSIDARLIKCRDDIEFDEARLSECRDIIQFDEAEADKFYLTNSIEAGLIKSRDTIEFDEEEDDVCYKDHCFRDLKADKFYSNNSIEARLIKNRDNVKFDEEKDCVCNKENDSGDGRNNNSIEARLIKSRDNVGFDELDLLLNLCGEEGAEKGFGYQSVCEEERDNGSVCAVCCPLCGVDISDLCDEDRQVHTNDCLDKAEGFNEGIDPNDGTASPSDPQVVDASPVGPPKGSVNLTPVLDWLRNLGLSKYEDIFVREEIDWESLQWLTEEDLRNIGLTALGPRMKIVHALHELRRDHDRSLEKQTDNSVKEIQGNDIQSKTKLITDFFHGSAAATPTIRTTNTGQTGVTNSPSVRTSKKNVNKKPSKSRKNRDIPPWCSIPGAPFRVDAFKYLTRECSHWFLTHFHMDRKSKFIFFLTS